MKVFVAMESLGGEGDFSYSIPGELVHFPPVICDCPDCGCERAMAGFVSHKATTCFAVRDLDIDETAYSQLLFESLCAGGWVHEGSTEDHAWVAEWAREHIEAAADLPMETTLRISFDRVTPQGAG